MGACKKTRRTWYLQMVGFPPVCLGVQSGARPEAFPRTSVGRGPSWPSPVATLTKTCPRDPKWKNRYLPICSAPKACPVKCSGEGLGATKKTLRDLSSLSRVSPNTAPCGPTVVKYLGGFSKW